MNHCQLQDIFPPNFIEILRRTLQNCYEMLKTCFLSSGSSIKCWHLLELRKHIFNNVLKFWSIIFIMYSYFLNTTCTVIYVVSNISILYMMLSTWKSCFLNFCGDVCMDGIWLIQYKDIDLFVVLKDQFWYRCLLVPNIQL